MGSGYAIKALDESSWDAFAGLVEANNGVFGGCWCMGFHPDDSREPALNRERKLARVRAGRAHAALVRWRRLCELVPVRRKAGAGTLRSRPLVFL